MRKYDKLQTLLSSRPAMNSGTSSQSCNSRNNQSGPVFETTRGDKKKMTGRAKVTKSLEYINPKGQMPPTSGLEQLTKSSFTHSVRRTGLNLFN